MQATKRDTGETVEVFRLPVYNTSGRIPRPDWWGQAFRAGTILVDGDGSVIVKSRSELTPASPGDVVLRRADGSIETMTWAAFESSYSL